MPTASTIQAVSCGWRPVNSSTLFKFCLPLSWLHGPQDEVLAQLLEHYVAALRLGL